MLMELIIFAIVLVALQMVSGIIIFKVLMSKKFIKSYTKMVTEVSKELMEELTDDLL